MPRARLTEKAVLRVWKEVSRSPTPGKLIYRFKQNGDNIVALPLPGEVALKVTYLRKMPPEPVPFSKEAHYEFVMRVLETIRRRGTAKVEVVKLIPDFEGYRFRKFVIDPSGLVPKGHGMFVGASDFIDRRLEFPAISVRIFKYNKKRKPLLPLLF